VVHFDRIFHKARKQAQRIFYSINLNKFEIIANTNAKSDTTPTQKLRPTKEILLQKYKANEHIPDHERIQQILQEEELKQARRDNWN